MRGTTKILILFFVVFAAVSGTIIFVVTRMTSSVMGSATRTRDPAGFMSGLGDTILWTIVPIVAVTVLGLVVFFVFMRRIMGANRRLVATGTPGTAIVLDVRDTGTTINRVNAVLDVRLRVSVPGKPPYDARAEVILGRMSWGALQPGMTVAVKVDPKDARRVAIDWDAGAGVAGTVGLHGSTGAGAVGQAGMVVTPGGNFQVPGVKGALEARKLRTAADVIAEGERAEGTIQAVSHTGATAAQMVPTADLDPAVADDPMVYVAMQVQPRNGAVFAAQGIYRVPKRKLTALAIGRRVPVSFLPGEPQSATIGWSRV